jgi:hypothetical protein
MFESQGTKERTFDNAGFIDLKLKHLGRVIRAYIAPVNHDFFCQIKPVPHVPGG